MIFFFFPFFTRLSDEKPYKLDFWFWEARFDMNLSNPGGVAGDVERSCYETLSLLGVN